MYNIFFKKTYIYIFFIQEVRCVNLYTHLSSIVEKLLIGLLFSFNISRKRFAFSGDNLLLTGENIFLIGDLPLFFTGDLVILIGDLFFNGDNDLRNGERC